MLKTSKTLIYMLCAGVIFLSQNNICGADASKKRGELLSAEECFQRYSDFMRPLGWTISETPEAYIFSRGMVREYFWKKKGKFLYEKWGSQCYIGRESAGSSYKLKKIPLGFYVYISTIKSEARKRKIDWKKFYETIFINLKEHGVTALLLANTSFPVSEQKGFQFVLDLAQKHGIQLILQPSTIYFRAGKNTKKRWPGKFRHAEGLFKKFNSHPALLAWCFKEEVYPKHAELLSEYYTLMSKGNAQKPVYICNNRVKSAAYPYSPMPQITAHDRYVYKYVTYLGFLPSPARSLKMLSGSMKKFLLTSVASGRPFVHVGLTANNFCRQILEGKHLIPKTKYGWVKDKEKGWNGTVYYYPPKGGMRAQVWTSLASGAKGFFGWFYKVPATGIAAKLKPNVTRYIDRNVFGIGNDRFGKEPPEYAEIGSVFKEVKPLEKYILNMNRRVFSKATTSSREALLFTHQMETGGEYILAVVNGHLGRIDRKTGYYVDTEVGRMKGIIPDGPSKIEITLKENSPVFDLKKNKSIPVKDKKISITLEPGEGTLLLLGDKSAAEQIRNRYNF